MVLKRVMPCLLFNGRALVKTVAFKRPDYIGDAINAIKIYNEKEVDELIMLDIRATPEKRKPSFDKIKEFASECFMPFTYGGGVSELEDFKKLYAIGVEKVAVNHLIFTAPNIVKEAIAVFGAQAVVGVIDVKKEGNNFVVHSYSGARKNTQSYIDYLNYLQNEIGVGEVLLQYVDREGTWQGYDHDMIRTFMQHAKVPVIVLGGGNSADDIRNVLYHSGADAAAIGSMAVYQKKDMGVLIRFPKRENLIIEQ